MGVSISVKSNFKKLDKSLDKLGRKQLPFAFAKTLNDTMKAVVRRSARGIKSVLGVGFIPFRTASMQSGYRSRGIAWLSRVNIRRLIGPIHSPAPAPASPPPC